MSVGLLLTVSAIYLWVAANYLLSERYGMGLAFVAYSISNLGFVWDSWGH